MWPLLNEKEKKKNVVDRYRCFYRHNSRISLERKDLEDILHLCKQCTTLSNWKAKVHRSWLIILTFNVLCPCIHHLFHIEVYFLIESNQIDFHLPTTTTLISSIIDIVPVGLEFFVRFDLIIDWRWNQLNICWSSHPNVQLPSRSICQVIDVLKSVDRIKRKRKRMWTIFSSLLSFFSFK